MSPHACAVMPGGGLLYFKLGVGWCSYDASTGLPPVCGRLTVGRTKRCTHVSIYVPPRMRSNAVGGGGYCTLSLAWDGAVMMPLHPRVSSALSFIGGVHIGAVALLVPNC
jgi:hypothetical protein